MTTVGIVSALEAEARPLGLARIPASTVLTLPSGALLCVSGMGPQRAAAAARGLITAGAQVLVSFGLAGGLDPRVRPGTVLLPERILGREALGTWSPWRDALAVELRAQGRLRLAAGTLLESDVALVTPAAKSAAYAHSGAQGVDMESYAVAEVAATAGLPSLVVRVVVDAAADEVPAPIARAAAQGMAPGVLQVLRGLLAEPGSFSATLRLAQRYGVAMRALRCIGRSGVLWRTLPSPGLAAAFPGAMA